MPQNIANYMSILVYDEKQHLKPGRKRWECAWIDAFISSPYGKFSKISVTIFFLSIELQVQMDQEGRQKQMRDDEFWEDREQTGEQ